MAADDNAKPEDERETAAEAQEPVVEPEAADAEVKSTEENAEHEVLTKLMEENAQLKDQLLRSLAEVENVRRRAQREREDSAKYAVAPLAKDLLSVCDNLQRAIASVPADAAEGDSHLKSLLEGVAMTERGLQDAFARHHIEVIDPLGEKLDPHQHEAMFEIPDPNQPNGTVAQVVEVGYRLRDRLLRPARVGIAKGGPPAATSAGEDGGQEASEAAAGEAEGAENAGNEDDTSGANGAAKPGQRVDTAV